MNATAARPPSSQSDEDQMNLIAISAQLKAIQQRLELVKVEGREMQALRTGLTVAQSALESLLQ